MAGLGEGEGRTHPRKSLTADLAACPMLPSRSILAATVSSNPGCKEVSKEAEPPWTKA